MADRQYQERKPLANDQKQCVEEMEKLHADFPDQVYYRFFDCAPTYQALIIDDKMAFLSIPLFGQRGTVSFPCLELHGDQGQNKILAKVIDAFEKLWTESGPYSYDLVAYHDSWLTVDPIIYCNYNCKYCVLQIPQWTAKRPKQIEEIESAIDELLKSRFFVPVKTVLSFGNRTDPFCEANIPLTVQFIKTLESRGITNTLCLATKSAIPLQVLDVIRKLKHLRVVPFISYSGFSSEIEPGVDHEGIRKNFINLRHRDLSFVHFWRPLVPANATLTKIDQMLDFVTKYASASVVIGLKYSPELREILNKTPSLHVPLSTTEKFGELIPSDVLSNLLAAVRSNHRSYPIFRHTSCAVSYLKENADYNASYCFKGFCDSCNCPSIQRERCAKVLNFRPTKENVKSHLLKLELEPCFSVTGNRISIKQPLSQEQYLYLLHNLRCPIEATIGYTNVWHGDVFSRLSR
jgi:DNA repair photolyase